MKIAYKVWLDNNGKAFGKGPYRDIKANRKGGLASSGGNRSQHIVSKSVDRASERGEETSFRAY